jgi:hypothetical protein
MGKFETSKRLEWGGLLTERWKLASGGGEGRMLTTSKVRVGLKSGSSRMGVWAWRRGAEKTAIKTARRAAGRGRMRSMAWDSLEG